MFVHMLLICSPFVWQSPASGWCASACTCWTHGQTDFRSETHTYDTQQQIRSIRRVNTNWISSCFITTNRYMNEEKIGGQKIGTWWVKMTEWLLIETIKFLLYFQKLVSNVLKTACDFKVLQYVTTVWLREALISARREGTQVKASLQWVRFNYSGIRAETWSCFNWQHVTCT